MALFGLFGGRRRSPATRKSARSTSRPYSVRRTAQGYGVTFLGVLAPDVGGHHDREGAQRIARDLNEGWLAMSAEGRREMAAHERSRRRNPRRAAPRRRPARRDRRGRFVKGRR